jgi:hypothetical protein
VLMLQMMRSVHERWRRKGEGMCLMPGRNLSKAIDKRWGRQHTNRIVVHLPAHRCRPW